MGMVFTKDVFVLLVVFWASLCVLVLVHVLGWRVSVCVLSPVVPGDLMVGSLQPSQGSGTSQSSASGSFHLPELWLPLKASEPRGWVQEDLLLSSEICLLLSWLRALLQLPAVSLGHVVVL